jgi:WD40 repeat protein
VEKPWSASLRWNEIMCNQSYESVSYRTALHGHTAAVYDLAFTPDSRGLLSGSDDHTSRVWDVERGQCIHFMQGYAVLLYDVAWSPDGTRLASAGSDTLVTLWDVEGLTPPRVLRGHSWIVHGVAWSPDGRFLASCGEDGAIALWDLESGQSLRTLRRDRPNERLEITGIRGLTQAQKATLRALGPLRTRR